MHAGEGRVDCTIHFCLMFHAALAAFRWVQWTSEIAQVKTLPKGHAIGYGNTYVSAAGVAIANRPTQPLRGLSPVHR